MCKKRALPLLHYFSAPSYSACRKSMNYVIKMGDLGWRKQKGKSCLRVVCPYAAYRGNSFGLLALKSVAHLKPHLQ